MAEPRDGRGEEEESILGVTEFSFERVAEGFEDGLYHVMGLLNPEDMIALGRAHPRFREIITGSANIARDFLKKILNIPKERQSYGTLSDLYRSYSRFLPKRDETTERIFSGDNALGWLFLALHIKRMKERLDARSTNNLSSIFRFGDETEYISQRIYPSWFHVFDIPKKITSKKPGRPYSDSVDHNNQARALEQGLNYNNFFAVGSCEDGVLIIEPVISVSSAYTYDSSSSSSSSSLIEHAFESTVYHPRIVGNYGVAGLEDTDLERALNKGYYPFCISHGSMKKVFVYDRSRYKRHRAYGEKLAQRKGFKSVSRILTVNVQDIKVSRKHLANLIDFPEDIDFDEAGTRSTDWTCRINFGHFDTDGKMIEQMVFPLKNSAGGSTAQVYIVPVTELSSSSSSELTQPDILVVSIAKTHQRTPSERPRSMLDALLVRAVEVFIYPISLRKKDRGAQIRCFKGYAEWDGPYYEEHIDLIGESAQRFSPRLTAFSDKDGFILDIDTGYEMLRWGVRFSVVGSILSSEVTKRNKYPLLNMVDPYFHEESTGLAVGAAYKQLEVDISRMHFRPVASFTEIVRCVVADAISENKDGTTSSVPILDEDVVEFGRLGFFKYFDVEYQRYHTELVVPILRDAKIGIEGSHENSTASERLVLLYSLPVRGFRYVASMNIDIKNFVRAHKESMKEEPNEFLSSIDRLKRDGTLDLIAGGDSVVRLFSTFMSGHDIIVHGLVYHKRSSSLSMDPRYEPRTFMMAIGVHLLAPRLHEETTGCFFAPPARYGWYGPGPYWPRHRGWHRGWRRY